MALRRLLSGWLIAMAALARSVAQALERASEDRSAPAQDPVMAALAERYPGAPAHWLAHVAERTSQLADRGEAPLSLTSDPTAWPPVRPAPATEPGPARARPASRRDTVVPTLAALSDRSSEVWRRPDAERARRSRPVFASVGAAPTPERPTRPAARPEPGAAPRRPRSPLSVVGSSSPAVSGAPEPAAPVSDTSQSKARPREAIWSEPPPSRATPDTAKAQAGVQGATERLQADHALAGPKGAPEDPPETHSDRTNPPPAARRQRSWFFARSASVGRSLELSADLGRPARGEGGDAPETIAIDPASAARAARSFSTSDRQVVAPDETWRGQTPAAPRRSIFRALAALRAKPRPRAGSLQAPGPAVAKTPPTVRSAADPGSRRPAPFFTPSRALASTGEGAVFSPVDQDEDRRAPRRRTKADAVPRAARRIVREASSAPTTDAGAQAPRRQARFSTPSPSPSRAASRHLADALSDDRWPALPPTTFASPPGVEAPPPRWDQLAREQEEGRWSV